jgi:pyruvate,water dikinase
MGILRRLYRRFAGGDSAPSDADIESLRIDFKTRYHAFKRLLTANRKALETMADIELKLACDQVFGMQFIRRSCTDVSVNVLKMIKHLDRLSGGKYAELNVRFADIRERIEKLLAGSSTACRDCFILDIREIDTATTAEVGSKMANLAEIKNRLDINVPEGFIITAAAYEIFIRANNLQAEIDRRCQAADVEKLERLNTLSSELQQLVVNASVPDELSRDIYQAWERLAEKRKSDVKLALRSSALGEDSATSSFAGQYRSVLNVDRDSLLEAYKEVLASKYSSQAIAYRLNRGIRDEDIYMCVGCLEMVSATSGGVVYTAHPVAAENDFIHISATWGLPKTVVDGKAASDLFVIDRARPLSIIRREIAEKVEQFVCFDGEGVCQMVLTDSNQSQPSITNEQALLLAQQALEIETYYQTPQDIEWAFDEHGRLMILQCRPLHNPHAQDRRESIDRAAVDNEIIFEGGGITASSGVATGPVFRVDKHADMLRFPEGAVLVTKQALPVWASLLNRAVAVITEEGGFAGHLASVAREFNVPALFGASEIMALLVDNEMVTVDADQWVVWRGKLETLPAKNYAEQDIIANSHVYSTLQQISRYIVPLNLLDPDARDFAPGNCRTLHDITRFVHEKSVTEMFSFGKAHNFPERSSKQLHYRVPMKWWVLNLDDGFKREVRGKYIRLDNICSIPMLAFWEGYTAIPWDGPPPIDGRGLMSVMFRSTMNPALRVETRSQYADRNYFMISKNYCSLSSRLGYHFSTMEALISERVSENYVSFQFKGGAADYDRRFKRINFIRDILEVHGFRVDIRKDNLVARVENLDAEYMASRLRILGYLTLHTRQLDMIMSNPSAVNHYELKINNDLKAILDSGT